MVSEEQAFNGDIVFIKVLFVLNRILSNTSKLTPIVYYYLILY